MTTFYTPEFYNSVASNIPYAQDWYLYVSDNRDITSEIGSLKYHNDVLGNIIWGKKIAEDEVFSMIRNIPWEYNKVFDMYDDIDPDLSVKDYYCINTNRAVYKCLNNNSGSPSIQEPQSYDLIPFTTSDGYVWKYMYRLSIEEVNERSHNQKIPVIEDAAVVAAAIPGTVDTIIMENPGMYRAVNNGFVLSRVNNWIYRIQDNASGIEDYYLDSAFYIEAGPATGSLAKISSYYSNNSGRYVQLDRPLTGVTNISKYSISPYVDIVGDGDNASARTVMNEDGSIKNIEIISRGEDYTYVHVDILTSDISNHTDAQVRAIISPLKGHGHNSNKELCADSLLVSVDVIGSEVEEIVVPSVFNNFGLIKRVKHVNGSAYTDEFFDNLVFMETVGINGNFEVDDIIYGENDSGIRAKVISVDLGGPNYKIIYEGRRKFEENQTVRNSSGILAFIRELTETNADVYESDIISFDNIDILTHNEDDKTTFNIMIGTKP